jgi:hypothetical protein
MTVTKNYKSNKGENDAPFTKKNPFTRPPSGILALQTSLGNHAVNDLIHSEGQPVDSQMRTMMESRFHHNFDHVRVFAGPQSNQVAKSFNAKALTVGSDIVLKERDQRTNQRLMAHELSHVIHQKHARHMPSDLSLNRNTGLESEAKAASANSPISKSVSVAGSAPLSIQLQEDLKEQKTLLPEFQIEDFGSIFVDTLGQIVEWLSGAEGGETEVEFVARVPVYGPLHATGMLKLKFENNKAGYKILAKPTLGFSLGGGAAFADFLTDFSIETQGATGRRAVELLSLALEAEVRAMRDEQPPFLLQLFIMANPLLHASLQANRIINLLQGEGYVSDVWPWVADNLWGRGNFERAKESLQEGEFTRSTETGRIAGKAGDEDLGASVSGTLGIAQIRKIEKDEKSSSAIEKESLMLIYKQSLSVGPVGGEIDILAPITSTSSAGHAKFKISYMDKFTSSAMNSMWLLIERVLGVGANAIEKYLVNSGEIDGAARGELKMTAQILRKRIQTLKGEYSRFVTDFLFGQIAAAGFAERGMELEFALDLETKKWTISLLTVDEISDRVGTFGEFDFTQKHKLLEHNLSE